MENAFPKINIRRQVHSGPAGLNIPEIPRDAEDGDLLAAIATLMNAKKILRQRRAGLHQDARRTGMRSAKLNEFPRDIETGLDINQAYQLSIDIHRELVNKDQYQLTSMKNLLRQLCR